MHVTFIYRLQSGQKPLEIIYLKASNDLALLLVVLPFRLLNNYTDHHIENQATAMS